MNQNLYQKWFVVQIKPNAYELANRNLKRQNFETFLPKIIVTKRINNKFINKETYLFPGYIFVSIESSFSKWNVINSTYGVLKIITFNKKPAEIPYSLILALKQKYKCDNKLDENGKIKNGDRIRFFDGPFADFFANVDKVKENNRIWVLLEHTSGIQKLKLENELKFYKV